MWACCLFRTARVCRCVSHVASTPSPPPPLRHPPACGQHPGDASLRLACICLASALPWFLAPPITAGIIVCEMWHGRRAWLGDNPVRVLAQASSGAQGGRGCLSASGHGAAASRRREASVLSPPAPCCRPLMPNPPLTPLTPPVLAVCPLQAFCPLFSLETCPPR